jgi:hypothetical protein
MNRGNVWLRSILGEVAWASIKTHATYFYAQFHRIARRRGRNKAAMAVAHSLLVVIYHVLRKRQPYTELGADYLDQLDTARIERHHVHRLEQLGVHRHAVANRGLAQDTPSRSFWGTLPTGAGFALAASAPRTGPGYHWQDRR